jgi:hypothetical protein
MIFHNPKITEQNPLKIYFVIPKSQLSTFEFKYSENIIHPFELYNCQILEQTLFQFLKDIGKNPTEINNISKELKQSTKYEENILNYLYEKMGIKERKKEILGSITKKISMFQTLY